MDIQAVYKETEFRLNKLASNSGQRIPLPQFVAAVNKAQLQWAEARARVSERDGLVADELRPILAPDYVKKGVHKTNRYDVELPEDYFHLVRAVSTTDCGPLYIRRTEEGNINTLLQDPYARPSKEWEEALGTLVGNTLRAYTGDFKIGPVTITYYRYPRPVDIQGYLKDGVPSTDSDLEFNGASAHEIIDMACLVLASDTGDQARFQTLAQMVQANP